MDGVGQGQGTEGQPQGLSSQVRNTSPPGPASPRWRAGGTSAGNPACATSCTTRKIPVARQPLPLDPDSRSTLRGLLLPPDGYELDHAFATAYSLDLETLVTIPLFAAGLAAEDIDKPVGITRIYGLGQRLTLLVQGDRIGSGAIRLTLYPVALMSQRQFDGQVLEFGRTVRGPPL